MASDSPLYGRCSTGVHKTFVVKTRVLVIFLALLPLDRLRLHYGFSSRTTRSVFALFLSCHSFASGYSIASSAPPST